MVSLNENPILYELRKGTKVFLPQVKSFRYGLNSVHFRGSILWNKLPSSIKNSQTINEFKAKLKKLGSIRCTYSVCVVETFFYIFQLFKVLNFFLLCTFPKYLFIDSKVLIV